MQNLHIHIFPLSVAKRLGVKRYFPASTCINGHTSARVTSSSSCCQCVLDFNKKPARQQYMRDYYKENSSSAGDSSKKWKAANKDLLAVYERNRRARKVEAGGVHDISDVERLVFLQKGKCASCRRKLIMSGTGKYHVDHVVSLSKGGSNDAGNLQILCPSCNLRKNDKDPLDWAKQNGRLL